MIVGSCYLSNGYKPVLALHVRPMLPQKCTPESCPPPLAVDDRQFPKLDVGAIFWEWAAPSRCLNMRRGADERAYKRLHVDLCYTHPPEVFQ